MKLGLGCTYTDGHYNYDLALGRLSKYALSGILSEGVFVEKILMRAENKEPLGQRSDLIIRSDSLVADKVSAAILKELGTPVPGKSPIYVSGDGNCLYNAISMALFGHEGLAKELRVKTCIELSENQKLYEVKNERLDLVSPSISEACRDSSQDHTFSSAWATGYIFHYITCDILPSAGMITIFIK